MELSFYSKIENIFTKSRLSVYRADNADEKTALARYLYNIELCKSLYSVLNIFEIAFRNVLDTALFTYTGNQNWYDVLPLDTGTKAKVSEAKNKIAKKGKTVTHDRIIAELTLGFWTSLITTKYSQAAFQSYLLKNCFKRCPSNKKSIKNMQNTFDKIRILRNRVSHYERIIHWKDLQAQHEQILQCIYWIDEAAYKLALETDLFDYIYAAGINPFKTLVSKKWN